MLTSLNPKHETLNEKSSILFAHIIFFLYFCSAKVCEYR